MNKQTDYLYDKRPGMSNVGGGAGISYGGTTGVSGDTNPKQFVQSGPTSSMDPLFSDRVSKGMPSENDPSWTVDRQGRTSGLESNYMNRTEDDFQKRQQQSQFSQS